MDMQSTSLKTAHAPFDAGMLRPFIIIVSGFALVAGLVLAFALVRSQPSASVSAAAAEQALIDFRAGERALLTPQEQVVAQNKATLDVIAGERSVLTPQELQDQIARANAARWAGAHIGDATTVAKPEISIGGYVDDALKGASSEGTDGVGRGGYVAR
jgi:hypothetical protein